MTELAIGEQGGLSLMARPEEVNEARATPDSSGRRARPPRLVLRFAFFTALGLATAGAAILLVVRTYATSQAETAVAYHARFVAKTALANRLTPADFARAVGERRVRQLDRLFHDQILVDGVVRASLYGPEGRVTYSSDHHQIGQLTADSRVVRAAVTGATLRHQVLELKGARGEARKVLAEYVPVRFGASTPRGVFVLDEEYGPIAKSARSTFLPIATVLEVLLLALFVSLFPILRRVTRRLKDSFDELEHNALHDSLTTLPNRDLFRHRLAEELEESARSGGQVAVLLIDLDRFKEINDTLGHPSGDALLRELASRLTRTVRHEDVVARLGGDEFGIVVRVDREVDVERTIELVGNALEDPVLLDELTVAVGASIGVAFFPDHGRDVESLIRRADVAMYIAKKNRSRFEVYDPSCEPKDVRRLSLATELRKAIAEEQLHLVYQPKADLRTGKAESVEALVRWEHPKQGLLAPAEFIPLAEQAGLIKALTMNVLDLALGQSAAWREIGVDVPIAVNLDMANLVDLEFPTGVHRLLGKWGVPSQMLELEITEGTMMADPWRVTEVASILSRLGVTLAIDDFGTGYTSLGQLARLPVGEVKIDKSFVLEMDIDKNSTIVQAMIELGHNLGLRVVAEGIETHETAEHVQTLGCHLAQGFFICPPLSPTDVLEHLTPTRPALAGTAA
jgi:diguanylate cyclase (GGDEF)-like protein